MTVPVLGSLCERSLNPSLQFPHGSLGLLYGNLHGAEEPSAVNFGRAGTVVVVVGGETLTPLFQTSFLLLKTQVNLTLPTTCVLPFGEQEAPAFAVAEYALD